MRGGWAIVAAIAWVAFGASQAAAQTFQRYQCADGARFAVAFFSGDTHAHLQLDGKAIALTKKLSFSGQRYKGSGVTLFMTSDGAVLKRPRLPASGCTVE